MNIEQAINYLKSTGMSDEQIKAVMDAFTCEDAISREWLKTAIHNFYYGLKHIPTEEDIQAYIDIAPPVQPKIKTGHWECRELFYGGESRGAIIKCNNCKNENKVSPKVFEDLYSNERFCNHCGAKMESE